MTEEEIKKQTEEYVDKIKSKYLLSEEGLGCAEQGFQDGAKWGMEHAIQWHDLRKNPDDLPMSEDMIVRVITRSKGELICSTLWHFGKIIFRFTYNGAWLDNDDVIAWCELPQFKE